jgi:RNA polymerase sigma factor (sigma-70 family)
MAEDVAQDAISIALQKPDQFNDTRHLIAFLRETARRKALEAMRKGQRARIFDEHILDLIEASWATLDDVDTSGRLDALRRCMGRLSPYARRILEARYGQGLTGEQLAAAVGRRFNTVYVALSRTHQALAECVRRRMTEGGARG